jgi:acyl dehydratase
MTTDQGSRPAFEVGQKRSLTRSLTAQDVETFGNLTGDHNPIHFDPVYAASTRFGRPIVHGLLVAAMFSGLMGQELPGPGTIYLKQELRFLAPVYVGDQITVTVEIRELKDKGRAILRTWCSCGEELMVDGQAEVLLPRA